MAIKNKYQRQKQQYSNDGGQTWFDVVPANYRKGSLIEEASEDCNTTQWVEVQNAWYCIGDSVDIQYRWVDIEQTMCNGYDKYSMQKQQQSTDGGVNWTDTGNTRQGELIETDSVDCGYKTLYQWVTVQNEYICNGYDKYVKEKQQKSTDGGVTWTDTGNTRQGDVIELNSEDCGYVVDKRWVTVEGEYICNGYNKYVKEKEQQSTDGGVTWTDTGNTRQGKLIETDSVDCGYKTLYQWVIVQNEYICNGYDKYVKEKQQKSTDGGVTWTDTGNTRQGTLIESDSEDCGYKPGYETQYLTMEALDNAKIEVYPRYVASKLYYKIDNEEWKEFNNKSDTITLNTSSKIMFKEKLTSSRLRATGFKCSSGHINVYGNIMSLIYGDNFAGKTTMSDFSLENVFKGSNIIDAGNLILPATTLSNACYMAMFYNCTSLTQAPQLPATTLKLSCYASMFEGCTSLTTAPALPATTLAEDCYNEMFRGCTSLTTAPALPATELADYCYMFMFSGCTSLTQAPELPATTLAQWCYSSMLSGCTSLTTAPALPATTLAYGCYEEMFEYCTSLTQAPALPATTLAKQCYFYMFHDCTSLTTAPALPATTLASNCYSYMFSGCTSLTQAPVLPATILASECYYYMFEDCTSLNNINCQLANLGDSATQGWVTGVQTSSGTFTYNCVNESWTTGVNGIPENWTRQCE